MGFFIVSAQADQEVLSLNHQKMKVNFRHFQKSRQSIFVSCEWLVILPSHIQGKTGENTVMGDLEDDVDELTDSDFAKAAAIIFDKIDNEKYGVIP